MKTKKIAAYGFAVIWSAITLFPLYFTLISSVKSNTEIFGLSAFKLPTRYHFEHFVRVFVEAGLGRALFNSFFIASISTLLVVLLASMASFYLAKSTGRLPGMLYAYISIGIMVPIHSTLVPLVKLVSSIDGYNSYFTIIAVYATFQIPFAVFLITGYIRSLNKEIDESAMIDGCGPVRYLFTFVIPISMPIISTTAILTFLFIYNELIFAVLFLTKKEMYTISLSMLSFVGERSVEMGPIFAAIVIAILPMIAVYLTMQEKVIGGLSSGAVKG